MEQLWMGNYRGAMSEQLSVRTEFRYFECGNVRGFYFMYYVLKVCVELNGTYCLCNRENANAQCYLQKNRKCGKTPSFERYSIETNLESSQRERVPIIES